jgi:signal transduction histidine kinase
MNRSAISTNPHQQTRSTRLGEETKGRTMSHASKYRQHDGQTVAISGEVPYPLRAELDERSVGELSARAAPPLSVSGELTGGFAHDFTNILATIDSCLRLAQRSLDEPEKLLNFVAGAREGVARGLRLTSLFLVPALRGEVRTCPADANVLLTNLELFLRCAAGSSVRVVFDLCPTIPHCLVDSSQFAAAILNLVINARDAMQNGGEVRISTARCDTGPAITDQAGAGIYVRVRVQDNGPGMSEEVVKRIFESSFTTKGEKGRGLGVPQVCAFMRQIGGHVSVASEKNRGTTFDLLFPTIVPRFSEAHGGDR